MAADESLKNLHKSLLNFNKRAERASNEILVSNFVDSEPLFDLLSTPNNQVIYGRRGTGKTHALKYLAESVEREGDHAVYLDLRSVGSNSSIYNDGNRSLTDRAATLIVDVLNALYDELYNIAVSTIDQVPDPTQLTLRLDDLSSAISSIRITGMSRVVLKFARQASLVEQAMLCGLGLLFEAGVGHVFGLMGSQGCPQDGQLLVGLE